MDIGDNMNEEFKEIYEILSTDRDDVKKIKGDYQKDIADLLGKIRGYHINNIDISDDYDLDHDFDKYKLDDTFLRFTVNDEAIEYKIVLLQGYLQDLFLEKKFNEYRRQKEEKLTKNEYLEYTHNSSVKGDKISAWYQEFMNK